MKRTDHSLLAAGWSLLRTPIPHDRRGAFAFGWLLLLLFAVQAATGILLSLYYEPSPATAAESVRMLMRDVDAGWLVRGIHHWNSNAIVALSLLQLLRVLIEGTYRGDRAASWYLGYLLLLLVVLQAFTGALLPWDADAYATLGHVLDSLESIPLAGPVLAGLLRGGTTVSGYTLSRVHTVHVLLVPWVGLVLVVLHLWLFGRRRFDGGPR